MASATPKRAATIDDLRRVEGKAELIAGRVAPLMPTGYRPGQIAVEILVGLKDWAKTTGRGVAIPDNTGFAVLELSSGRESFSPDVSYYDGPIPADDMDFIRGAPTFAVEVRSEGDYSPAAEAEMAAKRADYFLAGTRAVWDVDPRARCVRAYRPEASVEPVVFRGGQAADAEPAVPGWRMGVDEVFA